VIEALEASAPTDLNEVRTQVESDLRLARALRRIEPMAQELWVAASRLGLPEAAPLFQDSPADRKVPPPVSPAAFAQRVDQSAASRRKGSPDQAYLELLKAGKPALAVPSIAGVGASEEFVDACFAFAESNWQPPAIQPPESARLQAATTRPAANATPRVTLLEIPKLKKWFVIEFLGLDDVNEDRYETQLRTSGYQAVKSDRTLRLHMTWFLPASIELRCGFEPIKGAGGPEGEEPILPPEPLSEPIF
jgi:hypothetical protein